MRKRVDVLALAALALIVSALPARAQTAGRIENRVLQEARFVPDEVLVKFRSETPAGERDALERDVHGRLIRTFSRIGVRHLKLEGGRRAETAIARLRQSPRVVYAEPNYIVHADLTPNDPRFGELYGMRNTGQTGGTPGADIHAVNAWDIYTGDPNMLIGVIDTGIDYNHPDLVDNMWTNTAEANGTPGVDDDHNGYVDDIHGYDFFNGDGDPFDDHFHGTHCAGTIAGRGNNGVGVAGVNWRARLVAIKFLNNGGSGTTDGAIQAIEYAIAVGVKFTSNSWGGGDFSQPLLDAINAAGVQGQLFVAAAGNAATNTDIVPFYPSGYNTPYVLSVAATDASDNLASFSNYGPTTVDLAAPGVDILSCQPGGGYQLLSGTSMATPHVAGVVGLAWGRFPGLTNLQVKDLILRSVDVKPSLNGRVLTNGRLNAFMTISEPDSIPPGAVSNLVANAPGSNSMMLTWTATGDDGATGRASRNEIRYSTSPINAGNFGAATLAPSPDPQVSGTVEHLEVSGLATSTLYHFALKAFDEYGNPGPISNVASGATLGPPDIAVSPVSLSAALLTGAATTRTVTIANGPQGRLDWSLPTPELLFSQAAPYAPADVAKGAIDARVGAPIMSGAGGPDGFGYRWIDSDEPSGPAFSWVDITTIGTRLPLSGDDQISNPIAMGISFPFYGATYGTVYVSTNGTLSFSDPSPSYTNQPLPSQGGPANLVAPLWDDLDFGASSRAYVHSDGSRFIVSWVGVPHYSTGGPYTFQAILYPTGEIRFQYLSVATPTDQSTVGIQNGTRQLGLTVAFNTAFLHDNLAVRILTLPQWLSVTPSSGRLAAGQSQDVTVRFDALGLPGGSYHGNLKITSNDPDENPTVVPATLNVTGVQDIAVSDTAFQFGSVFLGATARDTLRVSNLGTDTLHVTSVTTTHPDFAVNASTFKLAPLEVRPVVVSYHPNSLGPRTASLRIASDDPDEALVIVALAGAGVPAPDVHVAPDSVGANLLSGQSAHRTVTIQNSGGSPLAFAVDVHGSTPPGPSVTGSSARARVAAPGTLPRWSDYVKGAAAAAHPAPAPRNASLPVVVDDPAGDGGAVDLVTLRGTTHSNDLEIEMDFATTIDPGSFGGFLSVDTDQDRNTGFPPSFGLPGQDIGMEYEFRFFSLSSGVVELFRIATGELVNSYPVTMASNSIRFQAPLADLDDDGAVDVSGVVGSFIGPTDWFPDSLHGTIGNTGWLSISPLSGSVPAGGSVDLDVTLDASGLFEGDYDAAIHVASNDPETPVVSVSGHLHVTGVPRIAATPSAIGFGALFVGASRTDTVHIHNPGSAALVVAGCSIAPAAFSTDTAGFVLPPDGDRALAIRFAPPSATSFSGTFTIHSNDPDSGSVVVSLTGIGLVPPDVATAPDSFSVALVTGGTANRTLTISNTGGSPLTVSVSAEVSHGGLGPTGAAASGPGAGVSSGGGGRRIVRAEAAAIPGKKTLTRNDQPGPRGPMSQAGAYSGQYLDFGITDYGEIMPFQYPDGNEHLAEGSYLSGYTVAYVQGGIDHVAFAGYDTRLGIDPVSYNVLVDDPTQVVVEVVTRTSDQMLRIRRLFTFDRHDKFVRVETRLISATGVALENVVFKAWADWDVDGDFTDDSWNYDDVRHMAYAWDVRYAAIAGGKAADLMDVYGWNDYASRATTVDYPTGPVAALDGLEVLHYELGGLAPSDSVEVDGAYAIGDDLADLQNVVDRAVLRADWLTLEPTSLVVPANSQQTVAVRFDAAGLAGGDYRADVTVRSNDPDEPTIRVPAHLQVTGAPDIARAPDTLAFGDVFLGASRVDSVVISNSGVQTLHVGALGIAPAVFSAPLAGFALAPGASRTLQVTFTPAASTTYSGALTIPSDDPDEPTVQVALAGRGRVPPDIDVSPLSLRDTLQQGSNGTRPLTLRNVGSSDLAWQIVTGDSASAEWLTPQPSSGSIPPGGHTDVAVWFSAVSLVGGEYDAVLRVTSNDPDEPSIAVPTHLTVQAIPNIAGPGSLDLGTVFAGQTRDATIQILNSGTGSLVISGGLTTGPYSLVLPGFPRTLGPGVSILLTVRFAPAATCSPCTGDLALSSNDPDHPQFHVALTGISRPAPQLVVPPDTIRTALANGIGAQAASRVKTVSLRNTGGSPLDVILLATQSEPGSAPLAATAAMAERASSAGRLGAAASVERAGGPDGYGYVFRDSDEPGGPTYQWVDITPMGTLLPLSGDEAIRTGVPIGFSFPYYGHPFTTVNVSTNGWLSFTSTLAAANANVSLPDSRSFVPDNLVAPFWDNLNVGPSAQVYVRNDGARFIVSWLGLSRVPNGGSYTFQAILYPTGRMMFQYASLGPTLNSATIGIQNATKDIGLTAVFNAAYVHDLLAIELPSPAPPWMTISPSSATIAPGDSLQVQIPVQSNGMTDGDYLGRLEILSNDPARSLVEIPIKVHVGVANATLKLDPEHHFLNPTSGLAAVSITPPGCAPTTIVPSSLSILDGLAVAPGSVPRYASCTGIFDFARMTLLGAIDDGVSSPIELIGELRDVTWFLGRDSLRMLRPTLIRPVAPYTGGSSVSLSWTDAPGSPESRYDLWYSPDGGTTWSQVALNESTHTRTWIAPRTGTLNGYLELVSHAKADKKFVGVTFSGPFRINANTADAPVADRPDRFDLRVIGANPFRDRARLELAVPARAAVDVRVHDVRGALVRTLVRGSFEPGRHPLVWDGRDQTGHQAGSGMYFVRLASGREVLTVRLALVQ